MIFEWPDCFRGDSDRDPEMSAAGFADAEMLRRMLDRKVPFSDQRVLDERSDHAMETSSAESQDESCRYSSHEYCTHTATQL